jgi:hypothetical protein
VAASFQGELVFSGCVSSGSQSSVGASSVGASLQWSRVFSGCEFSVRFQWSQSSVGAFETSIKRLQIK